MAAQSYRVGDTARILMDRNVQPLGGYPVGADVDWTDVTVTAVDRLGDGRTRYRAVAPRIVEWFEEDED